MGQGLAEAGLGTVAMVASQEEQIVDRTTEVSLCNTSIVDSSVGWQTRKEGKTGPCGPLPLWQVGHSRESLAKWCQGFPPPYRQEGGSGPPFFTSLSLLTTVFAGHGSGSNICGALAARRWTC